MAWTKKNATNCRTSTTKPSSQFQVLERIFRLGHFYFHGHRIKSTKVRKHRERCVVKVLQTNTISMVLSPGIEPGALVPQTSILSIKLREQTSSQKKVHFLLYCECSSRLRGFAEKTVEQTSNYFKLTLVFKARP